MCSFSFLQVVFFLKKIKNSQHLKNFKITMATETTTTITAFVVNAESAKTKCHGCENVLTDQEQKIQTQLKYYISMSIQDETKHLLVASDEPLKYNLCFKCNCQPAHYECGGGFLKIQAIIDVDPLTKTEIKDATTTTTTISQTRQVQLMCQNCNQVQKMPLLTWEEFDKTYKSDRYLN